MLGADPLAQATAEFEDLIDRWQRLGELCEQLAVHSETAFERSRYDIVAQQYHAAAAMHFVLLLRINALARKSTPAKPVASTPRTPKHARK